MTNMLTYFIPTTGPQAPITIPKCKKRSASPSPLPLQKKMKLPLRPTGRTRRHPSPPRPPTPSPFPFLNLPAEIRNEIYSYLFKFDANLFLIDPSTARAIHMRGRSHHRHDYFRLPAIVEYDDEGNLIEDRGYGNVYVEWVDKALFLTNKQMFQEARSYLLTNNTISVFPMDLDSLKPARLDTMAQFTRFEIGLVDIDFFAKQIDLVCSVVGNLRSLSLYLIIPGTEQTRCEYWFEQVKGILEPLRDLHVRGQVEIRWVCRELVDREEVRKEVAKWLEQLGNDMMGGNGNGEPVVKGWKKDARVRGLKVE